MTGCKWRVFSTGPSYGERHWIARKPHTIGWDGIAEFRTHGDAFRFADTVARYEYEQGRVPGAVSTAAAALAKLRAEVQSRRDRVHELEDGGPGNGRIGDPAFSQCQAFSGVLKLIDAEIAKADQEATR